MSELADALENAHEEVEEQFEDHFSPDDEPEEVAEGKTEEPEAKTEPPEPEKKGGDLNKALKQERWQRQQLAQQLKDEQTKREQMERAWQNIQARIQAENAPKAPDFDADPAGYLKYQQDQLAERQKQYDEMMRQQYQNAQAQHEEQRFVSTYAAVAQEFVKEQPDFGEAYQYLYQSRVAELQAMGYPPDQAAIITRNDEKMLVNNAFQNNINPAEKLYEIAKMRGFAKAPAVDPATKIQNLQKGAQAARSLSSAPGKGATGEMTLDALSQIEDQAEFDAAWNKMRKKEMGY